MHRFSLICSYLNHYTDMVEEFVDYNQFNKTVVNWSRGARGQYLRSIKQSGVKNYSGELQMKLTSRTRKKNSMIFMVSFPFPKQGVWTYHGVGKGVPIMKAGTPATNRKPKKWWDKVQQTATEQLKIKITPLYANAVVRTFGTNVK